MMVHQRVASVVPHSHGHSSERHCEEFYPEAI
jgi:hypothetical protein